MTRQRVKQYVGFTLAELLIALFILGVISTFSIPKVITAQQKSAWNAEAKEAMATVSQAYTLYSMDHTPSASMGSMDLLPYINYVKIMPTTDNIDHVPGNTYIPCTDSNCLKLHNGSILAANWASSFGGTSSNNYIYFIFDPDGQYSGTTTGNGKSVFIDLHYNGRITWSTVRNGATDVTYLNGVAQHWGADTAPSWFNL